MKNIFKISLMALALTSLGVACTPIKHTINPDNLATNPVMKGKYTADFSGISTVLPVNNTYCLGSFYKDKMAYFEVK